MGVPIRYKEAFNEGPNLFGLAGAFALSAALLNPIPLIAAVVAEAAYLLFVPDSKWYETRLDAKFDQKIIEQREKLKADVFPNVHNKIVDRFARLEEMRKQIELQTKKEDRWFRQALRKLDYLLEKYLQFAQKQAQFVQYLVALKSQVATKPSEPPVIFKKKKSSYAYDDDDSGDLGTNYKIEPTEKWVKDTVSAIDEHYEAEKNEIDEKLESDPDFPTRQVVEKRKEILTRRQEFVQRIGLILSNLDSQMALMADTFGLINDEMRARSPEQVLADIEEVVVTTNSLTEAIEEVTPLEELVAKV
jgi:hypothetical protein